MFVRPECEALLDALSTRLAVVVAAVVLLLCFAIRHPAFRETFRYSLQGLASMPLSCALFRSDTVPWLRRALSVGVMIYIGAISYSLYLHHELGMALGWVRAWRSASQRPSRRTISSSGRRAGSGHGWRQESPLIGNQPRCDDMFDGPCSYLAVPVR